MGGTHPNDADRLESIWRGPTRLPSAPDLFSEVRKTCFPLRDVKKFSLFILRKARLRSQSSKVYKGKCSW